MIRFILTGYIEKTMSLAEYDKLEDGTFSGRIPCNLNKKISGESVLKNGIPCINL